MSAPNTYDSRAEMIPEYAKNVYEGSPKESQVRQELEMQLAHPHARDELWEAFEEWCEQ